MIVLLDGRNVSHHILESLHMQKSDDGDSIDVVSPALGEENNVLASFDNEKDAYNFVARTQEEIMRMEDVDYIDLRTQ